MGDKSYELSNHLGNVLSVVSDRKTVTKDTKVFYDEHNQEHLWKPFGEVQEVFVNKENQWQITTKQPNTGAFLGLALEPNKTYSVSFNYLKKNSFSPNVLFKVVDGGDNEVVIKEQVLTQSEQIFTNFTPTIGDVKIYVLLQAETNEPAAEFALDNLLIYEINNSSANDFATLFIPDVKSFTDYDPFGMLIPERFGQSVDYRYGFNGMEADDELKGEGNSYTTEFRQYDPRVGRWLSLEPKPVAWESPFAFSRNNPLLFNDPKGDCPDGNCLDANFVQADQIAKTAIGLYGNNIIGSVHNKDVVNKVYNHIANSVAKKYGIQVSEIPYNVEAHTFLTLTVQMSVDRAYSEITNPKQFEKYELGLSEEKSIGGKADIIIDRYISNYKNQQAWDFTILVLDSATAAEGALATANTTNTYRRLVNTTSKRLANSIQKAVKNRLAETAKSIDNLVENVFRRKAEHIVEGSANSVHNWEALVPNKDINQIKEIVKNVLKNGVDVPYKRGQAKSMNVTANGVTREVQVPYLKGDNGNIENFSTAFVKE